MENIRYGKPEATDEEVINAAEVAEASAFVSSLPEGWDTMVGEVATGSRVDNDSG